MNKLPIKAPLISVIFLATLLAIGCAKKSTEQPASIVGSWQLVSEEIRFGETAYPTFDANTREMIKIFNDTHFAFTSISKTRQNVSSYQLTDEQKADVFDGFGGGSGRYSFTNGVLTEKIAHMNYANYQGIDIDFKITLNGDTLIQEGLYPLVALGLGEQDGYLYSVFKKIP